MIQTLPRFSRAADGSRSSSSSAARVVAPIEVIGNWSSRDTFVVMKLN